MKYMPHDEFSKAAKADKVRRLRSILEANGGTLAQVANLPERGWAMAASLAGVEVPSPIVRQWVVEGIPW